ncbi:hypothetical protein ACJJTC_017224 [Scirpophaga incertulas]
MLLLVNHTHSVSFRFKFVIRKGHQFVIIEVATNSSTCRAITASPVPQVAATSVSPAADSARFSQMEKQICDLTNAVAQLTAAFNNRRERSRSRSKSRSRWNSNNLCWYHNRFGKRATRCEQPCSWSGAPIEAISLEDDFTALATSQQDDEELAQKTVRKQPTYRSLSAYPRFLPQQQLLSLFLHRPRILPRDQDAKSGLGTSSIYKPFFSPWGGGVAPCFRRLCLFVYNLTFDVCEVYARRVVKKLSQ